MHAQRAQTDHVQPIATASGASLAGIRRAAWPFSRALVRPASLLATLQEIDGLDRELAALSAALVAALYARVPSAAPSQRGSLLKLKRAVFGLRPLPPFDAAALGIPTEEQQLLNRYGSLWRAREALPAAAQSGVAAEQTLLLCERTLRFEFGLAVAFCSATLAAALQRCSGKLSALPERDLRSLYAYVCRFTAKVNPLHLFTHLVSRTQAIRTTHGGRDETTCEVVFDIESLLAWERQILSTDPPHDLIRVQIRPLIPRGERWQLWMRGSQGWSTAMAGDSPVFRILHALSHRSRQLCIPPAPRLAELEQCLLDALGIDRASWIRRTLDELVQTGVLAPYLIEDMTAPTRNLARAGTRWSLVSSCLEKWHLASVPPAQLCRLESELREAESACAAETGLAYHVNSFASDELDAAEEAVQQLAPALSHLRGLLSLECNFSPIRRVICNFLRTQLAEGERRPYLDLLAEFLRHRAQILARFDWGRAAPDFEALAQICRQKVGRIERAELAAWLPRSPAAARRPLCVVGPFDFAQRVFFLTNIFDGNRRFLSRYGLSSAPECSVCLQPSDTVTDVELAMPREHALNLVRHTYQVGFGFDCRWARGYARWLQPLQIEVGIQSGEPVYFDVDSGERLRFHHRGFLLASHLPVEYQLLLSEQADSYLNPFADESPRGGELEFREGTHYEGVCLRRDSWWVSSELLRNLAHPQNPVQALICLRRWVRQNIDHDSLWFYRLPRGGRRGEKPRLLDLESPLSVIDFRHSLRGGGADVVLTKMRPDPAGLWQVGGAGYVTELMVEI